MNLMINSDEVRWENRQDHNTDWTKISDHPYRILIVVGCGSGRTNASLNIIHHQPDILR